MGGRFPGSEEDDDGFLASDESTDLFDVRPRVLFRIPLGAEGSVCGEVGVGDDSPAFSFFVSDIFHVLIGLVLDEEGALVWIELLVSHAVAFAARSTPLMTFW